MDSILFFMVVGMGAAFLLRLKIARGGRNEPNRGFEILSPVFKQKSEQK